MNEKRPQDNRLYKRITSYLYKIGVSPQVMGFAYLREAIRICSQSGTLRGMPAKRIYGEIARDGGSTIVRVERNIRHAIGSLDDKEKVKKINGLMGEEVFKEYEKPTSGKIIYLLADKAAEDIADT